MATKTETEAQTADATPTAVVERFLDTLRKDNDDTDGLLADDVTWMNNGLPTIRGRQRVRQSFAGLDRMDTRFDFHMHTISADGPVVMTERTDVLERGRLRLQFWVCGRFDVKDGKIVAWHDYFDYLTFFAAIVRGLVAMAVPSLRTELPSDS